MSDDKAAAAGGLPHTALSRAIDAVVMRVSDACSWVWVIMVGVIAINVIMRYALGQGRIEFEELQWHLYAVGFLVGIAATYVQDRHVRIDVLYERFRGETRAWVEFYGILLLMVPFLVVMLWYAIPFVAQSFAVNERSEAPGGLPLRWAIKSVLVFATALLAAATLGRFSRVLARLYGWPRAVPASKEG